MHELSIAQSIVDIAVKSCLRNGFCSVDKITVAVGVASGVMPEALSFAFDVIKIDTIAKDAVFCIDIVPISGVCNDCTEEFSTHETYLIFNCPHCSGAAITVTSGFELDMSEIEAT